MIRKVSEIMIKNYIKVDSLWGIRRVQDIVEKTDLDCFPVDDDGNIIGVLTRNDLIKAHPNRIVLDAMTGKFKKIDISASIWNAKEAFDIENSDLLLVEQFGEVAGILTKQVLNYEIGKHIDLLTGLHKSDYILFKALEFVELGKEISVVFFDVNKFGYIDKKFGHAVGDRILQEIAQLLKANTPEGSYLCRYGGDEFVLLKECYAEDCKIIVEKLLDIVRQNEFYGNMNVSVSAGIAGGKRRNKRVEDTYKMVTNLINLASLASTKAKKEEGNLVLGYCGFIDEVAI